MKSCIIIGNGPSLRDVKNETLASMDTFGSNGILLRFDPTYYVAVNPLVMERFALQIGYSNAKKFLRKGVTTIVHTPLNSMPTPMFSYNPLEWVYEGHNVTFVCLQLAFAFGYDTVYLVGVDHRYVFEGQPNEETKLTGDDPNHFDPNYFKDAVWNNPDLVRSEHAFGLAKQAFEDDGRTIINCTKDSALEVFAKGELPLWLPQ